MSTTPPTPTPTPAATDDDRPALPFTSAGSSLLVEGSTSLAVGALLMTNPIFDVLDAVLWGLDRVDAFDVVEFMTRDTLNAYLENWGVEVARAPEAAALAVDQKNAAAATKSRDAEIARLADTPEEEQALQSNAASAIQRINAELPEIRATDPWIWKDRPSCQSEPPVVRSVTTLDATSVSVAFTEWPGATSYVITSVPDGIVATGALSLITLVGLNATTLRNGGYKYGMVGRNAVDGIDADASTQFWAPPSSACNATYRDAFNKFVADEGPEIVREAALNNEEVANNLYVRARKTQNDRKSTYLTVTIVFAVLFVLHAAALFACIALYR